MSDEILSCRWNSRAWTYQESILSKQHLVFTPERCSFRCRRDVFEEDHIRRACYHHIDNALDLPFPCCHYEVPHSDDHVKIRGLYRTDLHFEGVVSDYTRRNLTVESDILDGAAGLLHIISKETAARFICGIPIPHLLDHFLLWLPKGIDARRGPASSGRLFPSWSWAGWIGEATYARYGNNLDEDWREDPYAEGPIIESFAILVSTSSSMELETLNPANMSDEQLWSVESCFLVFTAECAMVQLSKALFGRFAMCDLDDDYRCNRVIINNSFAGMIQRHITQDERKALQSAKDNDNSHESAYLIALSFLETPWGVHLPLSPDRRDQGNYCYTDKDGELRDHLPFDTSIWNDDKPGVVNVLLVVWEDGKAVRKGVGQVHAEAWKTARPRDIEVVLG